MNIGSYLQFGNMLRGVYDANQQALINQQNQQRINDLLANDALMRQIDSQKFQDYLDALNNAGAWYRSQAANQNVAPASAPGQNSAQQPNPPIATPIPGAAPIPPLPPNITAQSAPVSNPAQDIQEVSLPAAPATPTFGPRQQFSGISTPDQVIAALKAKKISPNAAVSILSDMAKRGAGASDAASADAAPTQQKQEIDTSLPVGTYGRVLALAQNNLPVNLAARAAANLLKANPNMSDRELAATMNMIDPILTKQSDNALRLAGLSNTEMFKVLNLEMQRLRLGAQYPNLAGGESPYTPEQLTYAADMISNGMGNLVPAKMRNWAIAMTPGLAAAAKTGKIQFDAENAAATSSARVPSQVQRAIEIAKGTEPIQVQRAVDIAANTAVPKANSAALTQVQKSLSAVEPAYDALHANFAGLVQAAKQYGLGPATPINEVLNRLRSAGDPDYTTYDLFLKGVQKEFGKILQASTSARGVSVAAMKDAEKTLSGNMTLGQLEAAQKALETEGANVLNSLKQQRAYLVRQTQGNDSGPVSVQTMTPQDQQAFEWAEKHSSDPRAGQIAEYLRKKYGL